MPREVTREVMGVLDEIAADAESGKLHRRSCEDDAARIVDLVRHAKPGREVIEYRAVAVTIGMAGDANRAIDLWHTAEAHALADLASMRKSSPPFDEVYLERRTVVCGEPERVEESDA